MDEICSRCGSKLTIFEKDSICNQCKWREAFRRYDEATFKLCSKCHKRLPLKEFYKDYCKPDGYKAMCKECYSQYYKDKFSLIK